MFHNLVGSLCADYERGVAFDLGCASVEGRGVNSGSAALASISRTRLTLQTPGFHF